MSLPSTLSSFIMACPALISKLAISHSHHSHSEVSNLLLRRYVSFHLFTFFYYQITIAPTDIPGAPLTHSILLIGPSISDSLNHPEIRTIGFPTTVIIPDSRSFRYWTMTITDSYPER